MARTPKGALPTIRAKWNQAYCTVRTLAGKRIDLCLGPLNSLAAQQEYAQVLATLAANNGYWPAHCQRSLETGSSALLVQGPYNTSHGPLRFLGAVVEP